MSENIKADCVDVDYETLCATLEAFGFTQTGSATCERGGLYGRRAENADRRYLGALNDHGIAQGWVNEWFERNGAGLPE